MRVSFEASVLSLFSWSITTNSIEAKSFWRLILFCKSIVCHIFRKFSRMVFAGAVYMSKWPQPRLSSPNEYSSRP